MVQVGPCSVDWSIVDVIAAIAAGVNLCLLTFLTRGRIRKDRVDNRRWSICPLLREECELLGHKHKPARSQLE